MGLSRTTFHPGRMQLLCPRHHVDRSAEWWRVQRAMGTGRNGDFGPSGPRRVADRPRGEQPAQRAQRRCDQHGGGEPLVQEGWVQVGAASDSRGESAVEPVTSQNTTVTVLRDSRAGSAGASADAQESQ